MKEFYMCLNKKFWYYSICLFFGNIISVCSLAQLTVEYRSVISGLSSPLDIVNAGDGSNRFFVAEKGGAIKVFDESFTYKGVFLTVSDITSNGERGLLSLVFHPDYESNGFFWVYYTNTEGNMELARYHAGTGLDAAEAESRKVVLTIPHPGETNHNGGKLNFGSDGYLYFATGDGGGSGDPSNNAQNGNVLLGKMIRINVTISEDGTFYTIPPDNPFVNNNDIKDEVWALGLRNPFRWSFDRLNNAMWIGDVGQEEREEINYCAPGESKGVNYGWRCYEGDLPFNTSGCSEAPGYATPLYDYVNPGNGPASVTGGIVYRGNAYAAMQGHYFAADVYSGNLYIINTNAGFSATMQFDLPKKIIGFGEAENGELFAVSFNGLVYQLTNPGSVLPVQLLNFEVNILNGIPELQWKTEMEQNLSQFEIEYSTEGVNFGTVGIVKAANTLGGAAYRFEHNSSITQLAFYRLKMVDIDGSFSYSNIVSLRTGNRNSSFVYPSVVENNLVTVYLNESFEMIQILNIYGTMVSHENVRGRTGQIQVPLRPASAGVYIVQLIGNDKVISQKIIVR